MASIFAKPVTNVGSLLEHFLPIIKFSAILYPSAINKTVSIVNKVFIHSFTTALLNESNINSEN